MKILLTNDDGIQASGINALRKELVALPGVEIAVIAPNSNRSATARSITTREALWVEEVEFQDGTIGYATDGTPVDCVRFAQLGLLEFQPDLIVSGINHGANLGDDITYSGTVAAALEGIVLGLPAIAVSQQAVRGEMGWHFGGELDFGVAAQFTKNLVASLESSRLPTGILLNVNVPAGPVDGVDLCRLGKRIYDDALKLEEEQPGRRRYRIYGHDPGYHPEDGTDFDAIAKHRIAVTPLHFDLTDRSGLEAMAEFDLQGLLDDTAGSSDLPAETAGSPAPGG